MLSKDGQINIGERILIELNGFVQHQIIRFEHIIVISKDFMSE